MPLLVRGLAVTAFWDDSKYWPNGELPYNFALRGVYTRYQLQRPMTQSECAKEFGGNGIMTGQPWIGKERSFVHGRETVLVHLNKLPVMSELPASHSFLGVVTFPPGVVICPSV